MDYSSLRKDRYTWNIFSMSLPSYEKPTLTNIFNLEERFDSYLRDDTNPIVYTDSTDKEVMIEVFNDEGAKYVSLQRCRLLYPSWRPSDITLRRFSFNIEFCNQKNRHVIVLNHYDNQFSALFDIESNGVFVKYNDKKKRFGIGQFVSYHTLTDTTIQKYPQRSDFIGFHYIFLNTYSHDPYSEQSFLTAMIRLAKAKIPSDFYNKIHYGLEREEREECDCFCCKSYKIVFKLCTDLNIKYNNYKECKEYVQSEYYTYYYGKENGDENRDYLSIMRELENLKNEYIYSYYFIHKVVNEYINFVIQLYPDNAL